MYLWQRRPSLNTGIEAYCRIRLQSLKQFSESHLLMPYHVDLTTYWFNELHIPDPLLSIGEEVSLEHFRLVGC